MKIGLLGSGQLALMLAQAGQTQGHEFLFLGPDADACAAPLGEHLCAPYDDSNALTRLAQESDLISCEFESVPAEALAWLEDRRPVYPASSALATGRDRLHEKTLFRTLDIETAAFTPVASLEDLEAALAHLGIPALLKTRTQGYDGKGQQLLRAFDDAEAAWQALEQRPCILEALVPFDRELSIIAARNTLGESVFYPLTENHHRDGILRLSISRAGDPLQAQAESMMQRLLQNLDYVGVLALELFQCGETLIANEIAPRVHNSGHWTIQGAHTSQFANHLRAICGDRLGDPRARAPAAMVNLIGRIPPGLVSSLPPGASLMDYGKTERPGRKVGHINLVNEHLARGEFERSLQYCLEQAGETALAARVAKGELP